MLQFAKKGKEKVGKIKDASKKQEALKVLTEQAMDVKKKSFCYLHGIPQQGNAEDVMKNKLASDSAGMKQLGIFSSSSLTISSARRDKS